MRGRFVTGVFFAMAAMAASACAAGAAQTTGGLVVDREGFGIAAARIVFEDAAGTVARAQTDDLGRFTVTLARVPTRWTVDAAGYASKRLVYSDAHRLTATLSRKEPGFAEPVGADDLGVLPYRDVGYALSLEPFQVIVGGSEIAVGDRGLGGSANLDFDNGNSVDAPAHYLTFAGVSKAAASYGFARGTTGRFQLGFETNDRSSGTIGGGSLQLIGLQERAGVVATGFGSSTGDGFTRSRADASARAKSGRTKFVAAAFAESGDDRTGVLPTWTTERGASLAVEGAAGGWKLRAQTKLEAKTKLPDGGYDERESASSYKALASREAGGLTSEFGLSYERHAGSRIYPNSASKRFTGTVTEALVFATEGWTTGRLTTTAGVASYTLTSDGTTKDVKAGLAQSARGAVGTLAATWAFDDHLRLELARAGGEDTPPQSIYFGDPIGMLMLDVSTTDEATLSYRTKGGFVASATTYAERYVGYLGTTTLYGRGASVDWPIGDRWRLRAWTIGLNDASAAIPAATLGPSHGRDVGWLTYYASPGVRFDAIYRRESDPIEAGHYLDADAAIELNGVATLVFTTERHALASSTGVSLRFGHH